jgi:hypothetical protein
MLQIPWPLLTLKTADRRGDAFCTAISEGCFMLVLECSRLAIRTKPPTTTARFSRPPGASVRSFAPSLTALCWLMDISSERHVSPPNFKTKRRNTEL